MGIKRSKSDKSKEDSSPESFEKIRIDEDEEIEKNDFTRPRNYQTELLNKALVANSIVYLGTGSGKTYIAVMMIKEFKHEVLSEQKKTVFLVNSVPLVTQQKKYLQQNLDLVCESFCGADGVDFWSEKDWTDKVKNSQVLVMIHQVFLNAINHNFFDLGDVNLLIVDECHHAVGNSAYVQIFQKYKEFKLSNQSKLPRVLGLSASIVTSKCTVHKFLEQKKALERTLDSTVITTENIKDLLMFVTQPQEETRTYHQSNSFSDHITELLNEVEVAVSELERILFQERILQAKNDSNWKSRLDEIEFNKNCEKNKKKLKKFTRLMTQVRTNIQNVGILCAIDVVKETEILVDIEVMTAEDQLSAELSQVCQTGFAKLRKLLSQAVDQSGVPEEEKLEQFSSKKALVLLQILKEIPFEDSGNSRVIVFVKERQTAPALAHLINLAKIVGVRTGSAFGSTFPKIRNPSSALLDKFGEERAKLDQTIQDFRQGKINVIVSTAVLEEGMDVQMCDLVVHFDPIQQFRSYVQSKGRARARPSRFITMVELKDLAKWESDLREYRQIEKISIDHCHPIIDTEDDDDDNGDNIILEPYYADPEKKEGPRITMYESVSLIHQYVQRLPCDRFTTLTPYWEIKAESDLPRNKLLSGLGIASPQKDLLLAGLGIVTPQGFRCTLHLPHLSPYIQPIVGDLQPTKKAAKCSVALKACSYLHRDDILDDHLVLRKKASLLDGLDDDNSIDSRKPKSGTRRSRAYYPVHLPLELTSTNVNKTPCYVYRINLNLKEVSEFARIKKQYKIYRPENVNRKLAIVVGKKLPEVSLQAFELFTLSGTVEVQAEFVESIDSISQATLNQILAFQTEVIPKVLQSQVPWTELDSSSSDFLIIPVDKNGKLDKYCLQTVLQPPRRPSYTNFIFRESDFTDAVIRPIHKDTNDLFFVEEIVSDMSPLSLMPNNNSLSFKNFYNVKHGRVVKQDKQPLLRISNANKYHFRFAPVSSNGQEFGQQSRMDFLARKTLFIPELVEIEPVPGSLWREIQMLPFIIERLSSFIKIGEFRQSIDEETSLGVVKKYKDNSDVDHIDDIFTRLITQKSSRSTGLPSIQDFQEAFTLTGAGELFDLERFEILGDAFLKFSVSLSLFLNPSIRLKNEGCLTQYRSMLVGNKNLLNCARSKNFDLVLSARRFEPHLCWLAPRLKQTQDLESILCSWDDDFRESFYTSEEEKEKLPSATLFHTMTQQDIVGVLNSGFDEKTKENLFKKARKMMKEMKLPGKDRTCPRKFVLISDKSFADSAEALIGVFLSRLGQVPALEIMSWMGLDLSPDTPIAELIGRVKNKSMTTNVNKANRTFDWFLKSESFPVNAVACQQTHLLEEKFQLMEKRLDVVSIEEVLGYRFQEKSFVIQAFTHASYSPNKLTDSYEQLEFLGDAVIDFLVTCYLFTSATEQLSPGEITDVRSALVNNNTLASICVKCGFHKHLLYQSPQLLQIIDKYLYYCQSEDDNLEQDGASVADPVAKARQLLENLELNNEQDCPILEIIEVPKVLGDIVEALMGAIFLDCKGDLGIVWRVFRKIFPDMAKLIKEKPKNPVKVIFERFPAKIQFKNAILRPDRKVSLDAVVSLKKGDTKFRGIGENKKFAKIAAAKCAIRELKKQNLF